jgi:hypothetical protein
MTEQDKILDRVRKLLELAKSDNVNEAGNAAKQAQILMSRHAITEAMVDVEADDDEAMEEIETGLLHREGRQLATWKGRLGMVMCEVNQCKCYRNGPSLRIIGRPSDATTVRYLFSYVAREIERLCAQEADLRGNPGRTWRNNFRLGATEEVNRRLREAHKEARAAMKQEAQDGDTLGNGVALVRVNSALAKLDARQEAAEDYGKRVLKLRKGSGSHSRYDSDGRAAGKRAGASIDLGGARAGLGSGERRKLGS